MLIDIIDLPFSIPDSTRLWLSNHGFESVASCELIGSGHHECYLMTGYQGNKVVAKIASKDNAQALYTETLGLVSLAESGALRTPEVLVLENECLLLQYIEEQQQNSNYWQQLAHGLAVIHRQTSESEASLSEPYGLGYDNYCGALLQPNGWYDDAHTFFAEQRLLYQGRLAHDMCLLDSPWIIKLESICERLPELIPWQPPSLLHGDLWPGNILVDEHGKPALIDPAIYYGWREADIAMTLLFGGLPHEFYVAYDEQWPMEDQWRNRVPLYNLYHLLNHLNIFGGSYLEQVKDVINRYA